MIQWNLRISFLLWVIIHRLDQGGLIQLNLVNLEILHLVRKLLSMTLKLQHIIELRDKIVSLAEKVKKVVIVFKVGRGVSVVIVSQ